MVLYSIFHQCIHGLLVIISFSFFGGKKNKLMLLPSRLKPIEFNKRTDILKKLMAGMCTVFSLEEHILSLCLQKHVLLDPLLKI